MLSVGTSNWQQLPSTILFLHLHILLVYRDSVLYRPLVTTSTSFVRPLFASTTLKQVFQLTFLQRFKPELWGQLATELGVPWRSAEAMHWALGEQEMARRAGAVRFTMASSNNANPANVSSSSSTSGVEASGYGPPELTTGVYGAGGGIEITAARASEERESRDGRRQRRPASVQLMQGQQLAPVGQGMEFGQGGHGVVLPSLAELTGGVPAFAGFGRERRHREGSDQGRRLPERDSAVQQPGQREAKGERRGGRERLGSEEREVDEQGQESSRRR